jgi:cytochrome b6-f complex iron-sulfur subunit
LGPETAGLAGLLSQASAPPIVENDFAARAQPMISMPHDNIPRKMQTNTRNSGGDGSTLVAGKPRGERSLSRRAWGTWLLKGGLAGLAGYAGWKIFGSGGKREKPEPPDLTVVAAGANEVPPNSAKTFTFGPHEALLIRLPGGDYRALTAVCTHMGCNVRYLPSVQQIWCPCHKGIFDVNGDVVSGPPPRPLRRYAVTVSGGEILVSNRA